MKITQAIRKAFQTVSAQKGGTLKFLAAEGALTLMCLAPLLFLTQQGPVKYLAALSAPMWLLVKVPARVNAAAAMQDAAAGGAIFSLRLADPDRYGKKVLYGLTRIGLLLIWSAPLTAALLYAWEQYAVTEDGLTVLNMVYEFGGHDMKTGAVYVLLIYAALVLLAFLGAGFHSGDRHALVLEQKGLLKGKRLKVLGCRICSLVFLLPLIIAAIVTALRYAPLLNDLSGVMTGDVAKPSTRTSLIILGIGAALTVPLIPFRAMTTAVYAAGLKE